MASLLSARRTIEPGPDRHRSPEIDRRRSFLQLNVEQSAEQRERLLERLQDAPQKGSAHRARHRAARTPATAQNRVVSAQDRPDDDAAGKQASDTEFPLDA
jgi:hypothetical protein